MLTFQDSYQKAQRLAKDNNADVLVQLKQDMNTGYHMFNQKLGRYYSRKQQFTNLIANQSIYQSPIDSIRVMGMTALVTSTFEPTVKEIRSEYQWRQITSVKTYDTNYPTYYYVLGKDEFQIWPTPSQNVANGIRFWYQPQDHDLSLDDVTSTTAAATVTVTNGSATVTASASIFTAQQIGLKFQLTGVTDLSWYDIVDVPNGTTLTLKSAFVAASASGQAWRIGQSWIIPQEYQDAPMHYALANYFASRGNDQRSSYHTGIYDAMIVECQEDYSSSNMSAVITSDEMSYNPWFLPPTPAP